MTAECRRVLKPSGSLWVNLGDKMAQGQPTGELELRDDLTDEERDYVLSELAKCRVL